MRPISRITLFGIRLSIFALLLYWVLIFTGTHVPVVPHAVPRINDKLVHFTAFFGLATLLCYVTNSDRLLFRFGLIAAGCAIYAALDELSQKLVAGRVADPWDFVADLSGAVSAILLYAIARRVITWRPYSTCEAS
ncbi:MAG: VanZ family protein [Planctomycetota bacterium]